jgi:hypothetical protein
MVTKFSQFFVRIVVIKFCVWAILKMRKERSDKMSSQGFIKGMAAGIVLGACATMIMDPVSDRQRNKMRRKTEGMFKNLGNIVDTALDMFR